MLVIVWFMRNKLYFSFLFSLCIIIYFFRLFYGYVKVVVKDVFFNVFGIFWILFSYWKMKRK